MRLGDGLPSSMLVPYSDARTDQRPVERQYRKKSKGNRSNVLVKGLIVHISGALDLSEKSSKSCLRLGPQVRLVAMLSEAAFPEHRPKNIQATKSCDERCRKTV